MASLTECGYSAVMNALMVINFRYKIEDYHINMLYSRNTLAEFTAGLLLGDSSVYCSYVLQFVSVFGCALRFTVK